MKKLTAKYFGVALCFGLAGYWSLAPLAQEQVSNEEKQIEKVVHQFWQAMGQADAGEMKRTLIWPSMMQEVTPTSTGTAFVYQSEMDFDQATKDIQPGEANFADAVISDIKIEILNQSVASVTYRCSFRQNAAGLETTSMLTVLYRQYKQPHEADWKITYTTIPQ